MGRRKKGEIPIWKQLGIKYYTYKYRLKHKLPLVPETPEERAAKVKAVKEKYKNGIPEGEVERWIYGLKEKSRFIQRLAEMQEAKNIAEYAQNARG